MRVPEPPRYPDTHRHSSARAALEDGPKTFAELMAATGSQDGREIVRELFGLRADPGLDRDEMGRYVLVG
jgi:hypothetical protein